MSSNFLQRFKGKTNQISKQGVHNILGSKNPDAVYDPNKEHRQRNYNSVNNNNKQNKSTNSNFLPEKKKAPPIKAASITTTNNAPKKVQNPFLVSNPFYLDEEERERDEIQKRQMARKEEELKKAEKELQMQKNQNTKTTLASRSLDKKKGGKEWVKLGGLGANIGGDQWLQKKKKKDKMQQFASQVKSSNAERIKPPKPEKKKEQSKEAIARRKALEYSKNIPKPVVKRVQEEPEEYVQTHNQESNGLTELQMYEMRHQQLKKMINNNYPN